MRGQHRTARGSELQEHAERAKVNSSRAGLRPSGHALRGETGSLAGALSLLDVSADIDEAGKARLLTRLQRSLGNTDTQRLMGLGQADGYQTVQAGASTAVIQRDDGSVEQILERQGVHAGDYLLSATVRMAPQQILATTDYGTVETGTEGTEVEAYLSAEEFQINFPTPLTFVPRVRGYQIMRSVRIEGFSWNWSQQRVTIRWTGPLLLALIRDQISARVAGRLRSALPARMFAPRYNPFADTRLLEELPTLLGNFSMGEAGGGGMPRTSLTQVSASATLSQPFAVSHPSAPDGQFVIPRDTRLNAVASLGRVEHLAEASRHLPEQTRGEPEWRPLARMVEGQLPPSLEELGIQRINLRFERHAAQVCYAEIPLLMIQEAELTYGGQLRLRYGLPGERTFRALRGEELPLRENELTEFAEEQLRNFILSGGLPETLAIMAGY